MHVILCLHVLCDGRGACVLCVTSTTRVHVFTDPPPCGGEGPFGSAAIEARCHVDGSAVSPLRRADDARQSFSAVYVFVRACQRGGGLVTFLFAVCGRVDRLRAGSFTWLWFGPGTTPTAPCLSGVRLVHVCLSV